VRHADSQACRALTRAQAGDRIAADDAMRADATQGELMPSIFLRQKHGRLPLRFRHGERLAVRQHAKMFALIFQETGLT